MIVQKDFLNKLKDFGLNSYESKLWAALLSRGISTAGELSDIANVPRSRAYDVLESLEKKGFVVMKIGKPIKYIAVSPEEAIVRVKKRITENAAIQTKILDKLKKSIVLNDLNLLYVRGVKTIDPTELAGNLKGRDNIYNYLENAIKKAEKCVVISTTKGGLLRKYESLKSSLEKANKKGVKIKIVAPLTKDTQGVFKELSKFAEIRAANGESRFFILDGEKIVFPLLGDKEISHSYDTAVWVDSKFFAGAIENMFNKFWSTLK